MTEPTVPPVTDAAIEAAASVLGVVRAVNRDYLRIALEAAAPHMVPAPALPTEPGQLVIAATGGPVQREMTLCLGPTGYWRPLDGSEHFLPSSIGDWTPARVVPNDEHGPVAVLRRVAELLGDTATAPTGIRDELLIVIGVCLERVDGAS